MCHEEPSNTGGFAEDAVAAIYETWSVLSPDVELSPL